MYRFVSYPDILKGEPLSRAEGAGEGDGLGVPGSPSGSLRDKENSNSGGAGCLEKAGSVAVLGAAAAAQAKATGRNDYIHSGLYTTFTLTSLQSGTQLFKSIKMENPGEKLMAEKKGTLELSQPQIQHTLQQQQQQPPQQQLQSSAPSVIRFGTIPGSRPPATGSPVDTKPKPLPLASLTQSVVHPLQALTAAGNVEVALTQTTTGSFEDTLVTAAGSSSVPIFSLTGIHSGSSSPTNTVPDSSQELVIDSDIESSSQTSDIQRQVRLSTSNSSLCFHTKRTIQILSTALSTFRSSKMQGPC